MSLVPHQDQVCQEDRRKVNLNRDKHRSNRTINYYDLLQVNRDAHCTIIRYAYRFLATMYHPDNVETGDAEKFRIITDAWRTRSDESKCAAYDMSLRAQQQAAPQQAGGATGAQQTTSFSSRAGMPKMPTTGVAFNETKMRIAMLQILYAQRRKKCSTGGASAKMMMDILKANQFQVKSRDIPAFSNN